MGKSIVSKRYIFGKEINRSLFLASDFTRKVFEKIIKNRFLAPNYFVHHLNKSLSSKVAVIDLFFFKLGPIFWKNDIFCLEKSQNDDIFLIFFSPKFGPNLKKENKSDVYLITRKNCSMFWVIVSICLLINPFVETQPIRCFGNGEWRTREDNMCVFRHWYKVSNYLQSINTLHAAIGFTIHSKSFCFSKCSKNFLKNFYTILFKHF